MTAAGRLPHLGRTRDGAALRCVCTADGADVCSLPAARSLRGARRSTQLAVIRGTSAGGARQGAAPARHVRHVRQAQKSWGGCGSLAITDRGGPSQLSWCSNSAPPPAFLSLNDVSNLTVRRPALPRAEGTNTTQTRRWGQCRTGHSRTSSRASRAGGRAVVSRSASGWRPQTIAAGGKCARPYGRWGSAGRGAGRRLVRRSWSGC
eukprot:4758108-Prymnesium_polylepis.2